MYMDRFNRPSYGPYGEPPGQNGLYVNPYQPYRLPTERNPGTDPTVADPVIQDPYVSGTRRAAGNIPSGMSPQTDAQPPWANYGFDRVTPGPGGGLSYEIGQRPFGGRPYWANSNYLEGGMGGLRPGMSIPNYADYYRRQQRYDAMNPPRTNVPANVIRPENSAEYLAQNYSNLWNSDGTPRNITGAYGPNGPINIPMPRQPIGGYAGGSGSMYSSNNGYQSQPQYNRGGYGGMTGGFMGGRY